MTETKKLPLDITHLDIIKTIAVIIMVIDHLGLYFFTENDWFRAIGRVGMPVWFFMVGYASSRDLPNRLLIGALILAVADFVLFQKIFALSALATIIFLRLIINPVMNFITSSRYLFVLSIIILTLFAIPTSFVMEYGTMALLFAIAGYMVRHKDNVLEVTFVTTKDFYGYMVAIFIAFCILQNANFGFNELQFVVMVMFTALAMVVLITMRPMTFPKINEPLTKKILQYCGRKTLDIYVAHLLVFKVILFAHLALN